MRNLLFLSTVLLSLSGCLSNDVLDKDLDDTNFKESSFYTSGDFNRLFGLTVVSTDFVVVTSPLGDTACRPTYTLRLNQNFVEGLSQEWSDQIAITLYKDENVNPEDGHEYVFNSNYDQTFEFAGKAVDCDATSSEIDARLVLIAPTGGRATASIQRTTLAIEIVR